MQMVKGDAGSISHVDGQRVHRKSILQINFGENLEKKPTEGRISITK